MVTARNDANIAGVGEIKSDEEAAKVNRASVKDAGDRLAVIASTLGNYNDAIAALDAGVETGIVAQNFPTQAGALLDNAKLRLGLDVIASVTFGALSEGERKAAMDTGLPTGLRPPELKAWIENRKAAALKIATIQKKAVAHFSQTGISQRELRASWIKKYADTVPGLTDAPALATAGGSNSQGQGTGSETALGQQEIDSFLAPAK